MLIFTNNKGKSLVLDANGISLNQVFGTFEELYPFIRFIFLLDDNSSIISFY